MRRISALTQILLFLVAIAVFNCKGECPPEECTAGQQWSETECKCESTGTCPQESIEVCEVEGGTYNYDTCTCTF